MIDPKSRGCIRCARNLDAERMIDRIVVGGVVVAMIVVAAIAFLLYWRQ
jgi:hypothetical protein